MSLGFVQTARDGCQPPVLIRLVEFGRGNACLMQARTKQFQLALVANCQVDVGGMVVGRATIQVRVLNGCVCSLHGLLREWEIAAGDGVQVVFGNLQHD